LFQLEKDLGLPLVATNDSHYLCEDDAHAQDVMLCIQTGKSIQDTNADEVRGHRVLRQEATTKCFASSRTRPTCFDAHSGHRRALQHCAWKKSATRFPHFDVPRATPSTVTFEHVTREGFARRLEVLRNAARAGTSSSTQIAEYEQRLARELASSSR
jgi:DNA polymerase III subunit alpha